MSRRGRGDYSQPIPSRRGCCARFVGVRQVVRAVRHRALCKAWTVPGVCPQGRLLSLLNSQQAGADKQERMRGQFRRVPDGHHPLAGIRMVAELARKSHKRRGRPSWRASSAMEGSWANRKRGSRIPVPLHDPLDASAETSAPWKGVASQLVTPTSCRFRSHPNPRCASIRPSERY